MDGKFHLFASTERFISWLYELLHRMSRRGQPERRFVARKDKTALICDCQDGESEDSRAGDSRRMTV